jgi:hypothetical protein
MSEANGPDRFELASRAASTERSTRPRHWILLAGLLLVVALGTLVFAVRSSVEASDRLERQQSIFTQTLESVGRMKALQAAASSGGPRLSEPSTQVLSRIERAGIDAGLADPVKLPRDTRKDAARPGAVALATRWTYEVRDPNLPVILAWLEACTRTVPGLEVQSVVVRPEANVWQVTAVFVKWERAEERTQGT